MEKGRNRANAERLKCAKILEDLLDKKLTAQQAIDKWPRDSDDDLLEEIYCHLFHYRDDENIRKRDSKYASWQDEEIRKQIDELRGE